MADGRIEIDTQINQNNVNSELRALQREIRAMGNEMRLANERAMMPFRRNMLEVERNMNVLAGQMGNYSGTTAEFMSQVQQLGAEYKAASDAMINADTSARLSMIQTAGQMMNMTTQASRISQGYTRMGNPLRTVNNLALSAADGLNRLAFAGNASVVALRELGPNASMKALRDEEMKIVEGQMRFQQVALASMVTGVMVYGALHKAAMEANSGYAESFNTMVSNLRKAFEPMVQVFAEVMTHVWNFVNAIAEMAIRFNEAHPVLAKIIQGIMMLIPALTLLLSPLAVGVTVLNSFLAAWASLSAFVMPLITGLAAISATVWIVAAAIVGLVAGITYLWNTNEGFRNTVTSAWDAIKAKAVEVFGMLTPVIEKVAQAFGTLKTAILTAFSGDFSQLTAIFANIVPSIIGFLVGGIPGLIISASRFIPAISEGITSNAASLSTTIQTVVDSIVTFLTTQVPLFIQQGVQIITNIVQGIVTALPLIIEALVNIVTMIVPLIAELLPVLLNAGIQIVQAIIQGIVTILPVLIETGIQLITTLITVIAENLPLLLNAGIQMITTIIDGILQILPSVIDTALQLITTIIDAIATNLPMLLNAGIDIVLSLIDGIVQILPQLIDTAIQLIDTIVQIVSENLPKIIDAGVQVLLSLIDGIIQVLPTLINTAIDLIVKIVQTLIENLPKILEAGGEILQALVDGINKLLPALYKAVGDLMVDIYREIKENLPKILDGGKELIGALIDGIISKASDVAASIRDDIVESITSVLEGVDLSDTGMNIIKGLISGLASMAGSVLTKAKEIASNIKSTISGAFDIHSPSRWMRDYIVGNLYKGFDLGVGDHKVDFSKTAEVMSSVMMPDVSKFLTPVSASSGFGGYRQGNQTITVELDGRTIGKAVAPTVAQVITVKAR